MIYSQVIELCDVRRDISMIRRLLFISLFQRRFVGSSPVLTRSYLSLLNTHSLSLSVFLDIIPEKRIIVPRESFRERDAVSPRYFRTVTKQPSQKIAEKYKIERKRYIQQVSGGGSER